MCWAGPGQGQLPCPLYRFSIWKLPLVHTVKFVRKFHTIGLFSEQALESLHQIMNVDEKKYFHLNKQPVTKTKSVMDQQNIRAVLN